MVATTPTVYDSTFSENSATGFGGGLGADTISVFGTVLANNSAPANPDLDVNGGYASFDLIQNPGNLTVGSSVITGQHPQLGPLLNNGGDMPTLKAAAGCPVVDQSYS